MRYVIVLDFGYPKDPSTAGKSSINDLAAFTAFRYRGSKRNVTILAQTCTYEAMKSLCDRLDLGFELVPISVGQSGTNGVSGGGSYHVLQKASEIISAMEQKRNGPLPDYVLELTDITLIAHQLHMPRALRQAQLFGMRPEIPKDLPTQLYPIAAQWWCRGKFRWYLREFIGYIPLKLAHQI